MTNLIVADRVCSSPNRFATVPFFANSKHYLFLLVVHVPITASCSLHDSGMYFGNMGQLHAASKFLAI